MFSFFEFIICKLFIKVNLCKCGIIIEKGKKKEIVKFYYNYIYIIFIFYNV